MRHERVCTALWDHPDFEDWTTEGFMLYLYLMTSPLCHGITGVSLVSDSQIRKHCRFTPRELGTAYVQLGGRVKRYGNWLWLRGRLKHECKSPNHYKCAIAWLKAPENDIPKQLLADFAEKYANSELDREYGGHISTLVAPSQVLPSTGPDPVPDPAPASVPVPGCSCPSDETAEQPLASPVEEAPEKSEEALPEKCCGTCNNWPVTQNQFLAGRVCLMAASRGGNTPTTADKGTECTDWTPKKGLPNGR